MCCGYERERCEIKNPDSRFRYVRRHQIPEKLAKRVRHFFAHKSLIFTSFTAFFPAQHFKRKHFFILTHNFSVGHFAINNFTILLYVLYLFYITPVYNDRGNLFIYTGHGFYCTVIPNVLVVRLRSY